MRWVGLLVMASACGRFGFDAAGTAIDGTPGDGGSDAAIDSASEPPVDAPPDAPTSGACVAPGNPCSFPGPTSCSCWGTPTALFATIAEGAGSLRITPNANMSGAQGYCGRAATPFGAGGAILEVSQVLAGQGLTALHLGSSPDVYAINATGGNLVIEDGSGTLATIGYDPAMMRFWRIRPAGNGVIFETAPGADQWTLVATSTRAPAAAYDMLIYVGTPSAVAAPGTAQIESVNVCP